jgi:hypothetical protein
MPVTPAVIVTGGGPNNELPGVPPAVDNSLPEIPGPVDPGWGVPLPPVTVWPIPPGPSHPIVLPPTYPVHPDNSLPVPPSVWPQPPNYPDNSLPIAPVFPTHPIYRPVAPNHDLPLPPGAVWPPLPPSLPAGQYMCLVWIPGVAYRWTVIDTNLKPAHPIVPPSGVGIWPSPGHPDQGLPPSGNVPVNPIDPGGQPTPTRR